MPVFVERCKTHVNVLVKKSHSKRARKAGNPGAVDLVEELNEASNISARGAHFAKFLPERKPWNAATSHTLIQVSRVQHEYFLLPGDSMKHKLYMHVILYLYDKIETKHC